ncbi:MAG TPA: PAS domain-containing protein, partial [Opitutus sp.]|nr:PAS domain-containing protein [Opitutus sp.]
MTHPTATPQPWEDNRVRILEAATEGFFALDSEWRFTYFSADAAKVLRVPQEGMVGEVIWSKFPEMVDSDFARALRQTAAQQAGSAVITFCPDHHCWYETRSYRTPEGITVYVRDITEQRRSEEERTQAWQEWERQRRIFTTALGNTTSFH